MGVCCPTGIRAAQHAFVHALMMPLQRGYGCETAGRVYTQAALKYGTDQRCQSAQLEGQPPRPALLGTAVLGHSAADGATCTPKGDVQAGVESICVVVIVQVLSGDWQLWCSC
jgi:hypothetical protein